MPSSERKKEMLRSGLFCQCIICQLVDLTKDDFIARLNTDTLK